MGEFAFPGPLRDQLVGAILDGTKTTTTGLLGDYARDREPLPVAGDRQVVVDSAGAPVAVIEVAAVRVLPLAEVGLAHALGEGEGYRDVAGWRAGHERFWHSAEMRACVGDPAFTVGGRHRGGGGGVPPPPGPAGRPAGPAAPGPGPARADPVDHPAAPAGGLRHGRPDLRRGRPRLHRRLLGAARGHPRPRPPAGHRGGRRAVPACSTTRTARSSGTPPPRRWPSGWPPGSAAGSAT